MAVFEDFYQTIEYVCMEGVGGRDIPLFTPNHLLYLMYKYFKNLVLNLKPMTDEAAGRD